MLQAIQLWVKDLTSRLRRVGIEGGHQNRGGTRWPLKEDRTPADLGSIPRQTRGRVFVRTANVLDVMFSNNHPAARYHQEGTKDLPKRPVVEITIQDIRRLQGYIQKSLNPGRPRS